MAIPFPTSMAWAKLAPRSQTAILATDEGFRIPRKFLLS